MADNLTYQTTVATVPSGSVIGTDEVTIATVLQHVQRVKLVDGADGGTALIGGDATNGLDVDVTRLSALVAGAANIGDVDVLTLPNVTIGSPVGGGTEAAAVRVTIANDSTGLVSVDDNAGSLTVDNAALSTTGGGVELGALRVTLANDSTGLVSVDDNAGSLTIDNAALSVTGGGVELSALRVTIANDSTGLVSVDDNAGSLTIDGTVTANAGTGNFNVVGTKSNNAVVPGATNLGTLPAIATAAAPTYTEGNQVGLSTTLAGALRSTGGTEFAEDAAHVSGDAGVVALGVRRDADTTPVSLDGDYHTLLFDATGNLKVNVKAGAAGGVTHIDDAAFTPAVDDVVPIAGAFDDVTPDSVDEGDAGVVRMSANRNLYVRIRDNAGNERGLNIDASGRALVDASGVAVPVTDNAGSLTVDNATLSVTGGGVEATALRVTLANDSTGLVSVDDNAGTLTVDAPVGTPVAVRQSDGAAFFDPRLVQGNVAHDAVDSGSPVKLGLRAIAHSANPTAVAAADRTDWLANRAGVPFVMGGHPNVQTFHLQWTTAQTDIALATVAGGLKIVVTSIAVTIDEATTVGVQVRVGFGATTTPATSATSGIVLNHAGLIPGGGLVRGDGSGILGIGADGEDLRITAEAPTSGAASILGSFYTIES